MGSKLSSTLGVSSDGTKLSSTFGVVREWLHPNSLDQVNRALTIPALSGYSTFSERWLFRVVFKALPSNLFGCFTNIIGGPNNIYLYTSIIFACSKLDW